MKHHEIREKEVALSQKLTNIMGTIELLPLDFDQREAIECVERTFTMMVLEIFRRASEHASKGAE